MKMGCRYRKSIVSLLVLVVLVGMVLMPWSAGRAYAAGPFLDLELNAPGGIRWNIGNIKPGDSAVESINLHNAGSSTGYVLVWIADLVDSEGLNPESETGDIAPPGELSSYLYLNIITSGLTFGVLTDSGYADTHLPVSLAAFPTSPSRALYLSNTSIGPGQTLTLDWRWTLVTSAGNEVQGDAVSFSIYYSLISAKPGFDVEGYPPPQTAIVVPPTPTPEKPTGPAGPAIPPVSSNQSEEEDDHFPARTYMSADGRCIIFIPEDTHVYTGSGDELLDLIIGTTGDVPRPPESLTLGSQIYCVSCFAEDGVVIDGAALSPGVLLSISFVPATLPHNTGVALYGYSPETGWVKIDATENDGGNCLSATVNGLDCFALLIEPVDSRLVNLGAVTPTLTAEAGGGVSGIDFLPEALGITVSGFAAMGILVLMKRRKSRQDEDADDPAPPSDNTPLPRSG
jgi:hypothetical protein